MPARAISAVSRRLGRPAIALGLVVIALISLYWLWFRDSSLVAVKDVEVTGLSGSESEHVRAALEQAARGMTTLHVDQEELRAAVRPFPAVRSVSADPGFPNGLTIHVTQHVPTALARSEGAALPVGADGTILESLPVRGRLPTITVSGRPSGRSLTGGALAQARLLGAAPAQLRAELRRSRLAKRGLSVQLRGGGILIFGDTTRLRDKWAAAASVLADPRLDQFTYIDLRVPERPAVGGAGGEPVADTAGQAPAGVGGDAAGEEAVPAAPQDAPVEPAPAGGDTAQAPAPAGAPPSPDPAAGGAAPPE